MAHKQFDFIIAGAGVVGLTLARELALRKAGSILVLDKEPEVGKHASGRNSGVVHAGIYYPGDSLKAKFCIEGARRLLDYVDQHKLPILKCGKVIVATKPENVATLETLLARSKTNGVEARKISLEELRELEPEARSHEYAIWSPKTAVIDSKAVLKQLQQEIRAMGVDLRLSEQVFTINPAERTVKTSSETFGYGFFFNTAGVNADKIAHQFGVGLKYRILPFKGLYWKSSDAYAPRVQRLIYPAPDIRMPFLGVHITRTVDGKVLFGPTAIPALGRENYSLLGGLDLMESPKIGWQLLKMLIRNPGGFRKYARDEMGRYISNNFYREAAALVHRLDRSDIGEFYKVGIRAQLMDLSKGALEMDFVLESAPNSMHVLNAISPAFTSSFAFATYLADAALGKQLTGTTTETTYARP